MMISRLLGFLYGDGWVYYNERGEYYEVGFQQSLKNRDIYEYYKKLVIKLTVTKYFRERVRRGKIELVIYDNTIYKLLKTVKSNPTEYFRSLSNEEKLMFIAGFTDADGYIGSTEVAIYDSNRSLLNEICSHLKNLGIKCVVSRNKSIWRLRIRSKESINIFLNLIPHIKIRPPPPGQTP